MIFLLFDSIMKIYGGSLISMEYNQFVPYMNMMLSRSYNTKFLKYVNSPSFFGSLLPITLQDSGSKISDINISINNQSFPLSLSVPVDSDYGGLKDVLLQVIGLAEIEPKNCTDYFIYPSMDPTPREGLFNFAKISGCIDNHRYSLICLLNSKNKKCFSDEKGQIWLISQHLHFLKLNMVNCSNFFANNDQTLERRIPAINIIENWFTGDIPKNILDFIKTGIVSHGSTKEVVKYMLNLWDPNNTRLVPTPRRSQRKKRFFNVLKLALI